MTLREFRDEVVLPNIADFNANFSSLRHAFNAIAAVDALAAHLYEWCKTNAPSEVQGIADDSHYREELAKRYHYFRLFRDIAKSQKHVRLTKLKSNPIVTQAEQVSARPVGFGEGGFGEGRFTDQAQVVVDINPGTTQLVSSIVEQAHVFLEPEMNRLGC
jgi:hypothetical protein